MNAGDLTKRLLNVVQPVDLDQPTRFPERGTSAIAASSGRMRPSRPRASKRIRALAASREEPLLPS
jgi:hypothetical protein